jgi:hypothetical protein
VPAADSHSRVWATHCRQRHPAGSLQGCPLLSSPPASSTARGRPRFPLQPLPRPPEGRSCPQSRTAPPRRGAQRWPCCPRGPAGASRAARAGKGLSQSPCAAALICLHETGQHPASPGAAPCIPRGSTLHPPGQHPASPGEARHLPPQLLCMPFDCVCCRCAAAVGMHACRAPAPKGREGAGHSH